MRYLVVTHKWFVDSYGFAVTEIKAADKKEAEDKMDLMTYREQDSTKHAASKLIVLEPEEVLANRELTWKERLTGKIE